MYKYIYAYNDNNNFTLQFQTYAPLKVRWSVQDIKSDRYDTGKNSTHTK